MTSTLVDQLRDRLTAHAVDLVRAAADTAVQETQAAASRRSGDLVDGIHHTEPTVEGSRIMCEIRSEAPYSEYQDEGTGLYGPVGARIFPTHAKALRFESPVSMLAGTGFVFAKSVAGSPGRHFFREPMPQRWAESLAANAGVQR